MALSSRTGSLGTENAFSVLADIATCRARGVDVVELNLGEPDFDTPAHITEAAVFALRAGDTHYCPPAGIPELRRAIASSVAASRGIDVDSDRVVVTAGAKQTIRHAFDAYVEPGDEVIYPTPGFPIYESLASFHGAVGRPLQLAAEHSFTVTGEQLDELMSPKTKLIILNSPSNPTGGAFSEDLLSEVADVISDHGRPDLRVYSDEIYEHITFDGDEHRSIAGAAGMEGRTVVAGGHSKSFAMTGWRLGFAVLPTTEEASFFERLNINTVSCVPPFVQRAGVAALEDPRSQASVRSMVGVLEERRDWMVGALNRIQGVSCRLPAGAFYAFPDVGDVCRQLGVLEAHGTLPSEITEEWPPSRLLQMFLLYGHGVATMDRASFGRIGSAGQHFLRLSFAAGMEVLQEGVSRLADAFQDGEGFARFFEEESQLWSGEHREES